MKKILFCTRAGIELNNSTGGQILRTKTSIKSLSKISKLDILSRNPRYHKNFRQSYLKKFNFYIAPSVKKTISKNRLIKAFQWRFKEYFYLNDDANFIINLHKMNNYDCIWIQWSSQTYFLIKKLKKLNKKIKIVADTDSVYFKFIEREIKYVNLIRKVITYLYSLYFKNIEKKMIKISDFTTAVSNYDKKIFESFGLNKKIYIFRNSVDRNIKKKIKKKKSFFNIIISGTFGAKISPMNVSIDWFLKRIYPILDKKILNFKVYLIGIGSDKFLKNYTFKKNLVATGWVKDIEKFFTKADIAAVPLLYESGTRFKILEAALYKIPVISTKIGAEGLPLKNNTSIFLEDDPEKFANKIVSLSKNKNFLKKVANKSYKIVSKAFSAKEQSRDALKILKKL